MAQLHSVQMRQIPSGWHVLTAVTNVPVTLVIMELRVVRKSLGMNANALQVIWVLTVKQVSL